MTDLTRRDVLAGVTATAATATLGTILISSPMAAAQAPDPPELTFRNLSQILTGISFDVLTPNVDPFKLNREILNKINETPENAKTLQLMLQNFSAVPKTIKDQKDAVRLMMSSGQNEAIRFLARSIILAWYLGAWYEPGDLQKKSYAAKDPLYAYRRYSPNVLIPHVILSSNAYTHGLVWTVMQAHPMGYSNLQFGYWAQKPPTLSNFLPPLEDPTK